MEQQMRQKSALAPCCADERNRGPVEEDKVTFHVGTQEVAGKTTMRRCTVCKRRHWETVLDPGALGLRSTG